VWEYRALPDKDADAIVACRPRPVPEFCRYRTSAGGDSNPHQGGYPAWCAM
jgi:hypothetical protein